MHEILGRRFRNGIPQWYVIWAKPTGELYPRGTHAWQPRHCFVDEDSDGRIVAVNALWAEFEHSHPYAPGFEIEVLPRAFDASRDVRGVRNRK